MMSPPIQINLFGNHPTVFVNGNKRYLPLQALRLLILMADKGESQYFRDDLIRDLYGRQNAHDLFRKQALFLLRTHLPEAGVQRDRKGFVSLKRENIRVDSREFDERANALLVETTLMSAEACAVAQAVLELYEEPFLADFYPKAGEYEDPSRYLNWQKGRRRELAALYHELLDRVTSYCLNHTQSWQQTQRYAELWRRSPGASLKPLQILIWLAMQQHSDSLASYLSELRTREQANELPMGRTAAEWDRILKGGHSVPLANLFPSAPLPIRQPTALMTEDVVHHDVLEEVLTLLSTARKQPVFGLVGLPGSGKTEMVQIVGRYLRERQPGITVVTIELPTQLDFEVVANSLLIALGRQDLLSKDYATKRQHLKQMMQAPNLVVIVDEGYSTHLAEENTLSALLKILDGARVMLVARELHGFDQYEVTLPGLDAVQTRTFLTSRLAWLNDSAESTFQELAALTLGLPLMLNIIASGLRTQRGRLPTLLDYLKPAESPDDTPALTIFGRYDRVLEWLWQYLTTEEKNVLYAMSLFAPENGVTLAALEAVLASIMPLHIPQRLRQLVGMRLLKQVDTESSGARFSLHPIVLEYIQRRSPTVSPYVRRIKQAFVRYLLAYAGNYASQFEALDEHQQNILRMFEWVLLSDQYPSLQAHAVEVLNNLYPYFERRGLYSKAFALFHDARNYPLASDIHVQVLIYFGKLAKFLTKSDFALQAFQEALEIAQTENMAQRYGSLHYNTGDVHMLKGRYADALESFGHAELWAQSDQNRMLLYAVWSNIAVCYSYQSYFELAQQYYEQVEQHLGADLESLAPEFKLIAQHNQMSLGALFIDMGDYAQAKPYLQRSLELADQLKSPELSSYVYVNLGTMYYFMKEYGAAEDCFVLGGTLAERVRNIGLIAVNTVNLGALASARSLDREAFFLLRTALIQIEDNDLDTLKPRVFVAFAKAYLRNQLHDLAYAYFLKTLLSPDVSLKHIAHGLYGSALSALLKHHAVGDMRVETALEVIESLMESVRVASLALLSLPLETTMRYLDMALTTFQLEFEQLPQLSRYRIVEAFRSWLHKHPVSSAAITSSGVGNRPPPSR